MYARDRRPFLGDYSPPLQTTNNNRKGHTTMNTSPDNHATTWRDLADQLTDTGDRPAEPA